MTSRSLNTHARTLELYDQLGVLGDLAPFGTRVHALVRHLPHGPVRVEYAYDGLATRFPYMFMVDQVITERVLRGHAAAHGAPVEWGTALDSFTQDEDGVRARLAGPAGTETVRARYLWGCDGGHSTVRKALGLPLEGETAHNWLIADARIDGPALARDAIHWLFPPGGAVLLFPFPDPGKWRLLDTGGQGDPGRPELIAARFGARIGQALGVPVAVEEPTWVSAFTAQQRAVPTMRVGRCFVSGDAAHVHSPASGQGMNVSIQDAHNLAWKLAMVVRGEAHPALLDTYTAERLPVGRALLATTRQVAETAMVATTAEDAPGSDHPFLRRLVRDMSGLGLHYADSPLTLGSGDGPGPRPGERLTQVDAADADSPGWTLLRAALREPTWHLLVFGPSPAVPATLPSWLRAHRITPGGTTDPDLTLHRVLGGAEGDWILVRPDGYLAARGDRFDGATIDRFLDRLAAPPLTS
jgi:NADPH-dependent dioxygenase